MEELAKLLKPQRTQSLREMSPQSNLLILRNVFLSVFLIFFSVTSVVNTFAKAFLVLHLWETGRLDDSLRKWADRFRFFPASGFRGSP
ncbi:MAG: hypothetical protein M1508_07735 [Nitrospirae bacterium]|nr:hypothetical protein [Nitrospirota bacterium]MCL5421291.1 hypothetical protein [Nitrospirota bacterium]